MWRNKISIYVDASKELTPTEGRLELFCAGSLHYIQSAAPHDSGAYIVMAVIEETRSLGLVSSSLLSQVVLWFQEVELTDYVT
jgi:hypothetical protein